MPYEYGQIIRVPVAEWTDLAPWTIKLNCRGRWGDVELWKTGMRPWSSAAARSAVLAT